MRGRLLIATVMMAGSLGAVGAQTATATTTTMGGGGGGDRWTCEATSARVKTPLVDAVSTQANPGGDPCRTDYARALNVRLPGAPSPAILNADVLSARTTSYGAAGGRADAAASVVTLRLGSTTIKVDVLKAHAAGYCKNGRPVLTGASETIELRVNGQGGAFREPVKITDPANPLLNIYLNEQTREDDGMGNKKLTQRALHIFGLTALGIPVDIVVGEAIVDVHGNPCATTY